MASGSRIESGTGSGRRSALPAVLALLLATCACGSNAAAVSPERARPWLGCYRITVGPSAHDLLVRLTDEPDGYDGYRVEFIRAPDREDMIGGWKPLPKAGFRSGRSIEEAAYSDGSSQSISSFRGS